MVALPKLFSTVAALICLAGSSFAQNAVGAATEKNASNELLSEGYKNSGSNIATEDPSFLDLGTIVDMNNINFGRSGDSDITVFPRPLPIPCLKTPKPGPTEFPTADLPIQDMLNSQFGQNTSNEFPSKVFDLSKKAYGIDFQIDKSILTGPCLSCAEIIPRPQPIDIGCK